MEKCGIFGVLFGMILETKNVFGFIIILGILKLMKVCFILPYAWQDPRAGGLEKIAKEIGKRLDEEPYFFTLTTLKFPLMLFPKLFYKDCSLPKADLYYCFGWRMGLIVPENARNIVSIHRDDDILKYLKGPFGFFFRHLIDKMPVSKIIVPAEHLRKKVLSSHWKNKAKKEDIIVMPNGVDSKKFCPIKKRENKKKIVLYAGRALDKTKGLKFLLEAFKEMPKNIELWVVGYGSEEIKQENARTFPYSNELQKFMQKCDCFVCPSLNEGLPLIVIEAMSCGAPVVASSIEGIAEIIENNVDGLLVKPADSDALKQAILRVLGNKELSQRLSKNARKKVLEKHSWEKITERTEKIFKSCLKSMEK